MSIWVAKSLYLTGSWSLIDCNVVSFGGFKLINKTYHPSWSTLALLFKTLWLKGNLQEIKTTSHQYPLICWQHSDLWCQVSGMSQIFKHPKLNGVLTAWDGTGCWVHGLTKTQAFQWTRLYVFQCGSYMFQYETHTMTNQRTQIQASTRASQCDRRLDAGFVQRVSYSIPLCCPVSMYHPSTPRT